MLETNEGSAPIRGVGRACDLMPDASHGLHGLRCAVDRRRARVLQDDAESVRSDGNARVSWLLSQGAAERLRQCSRDKGGDSARCCDPRYLAHIVRLAGSGIFCHRMD